MTLCSPECVVSQAHDATLSLETVRLIDHLAAVVSRLSPRAGTVVPL